MHYRYVISSSKINMMSKKLTPSEAESIEWRFGIESALSIFTITCISALEPTKWHRIHKTSLKNVLNMKTLNRLHTHAKKKKQRERERHKLKMAKDEWQHTFEIVFQLMNHPSILYKWDSIEINLIVHPKLDIFPVFICEMHAYDKEHIIVRCICFSNESISEEQKPY